MLRGIEEWRCLVSIPLTFLRGLLAGFCPYSETLSRCLVSVRFECCDFWFFAGVPAFVCSRSPGRCCPGVIVFAVFITRSSSLNLSFPLCVVILTFGRGWGLWGRPRAPLAVAPMGSGRAGWPDAVPNFDGPVVSRRQVFACLFFPFLVSFMVFFPSGLGSRLSLSL